jgi:hypothetical protein
MYSQAKEAIFYIVNKYGKYKLKELLLELSKGKDIDSAFLSTYSMKLAQFEEEWKTYIKGIYGSSFYEGEDEKD